MSRFEIHFELQPPYAFGIPSDGHEVAPVDEPPNIVFDPNTLVLSLTRPDGSPTIRTKDERVQSTFSLNGIRFAIDDNMCIARLTASDVATAIDRATSELSQLFLMLSALMSGPDFQITPTVKGVIRDGVPMKRNSSDMQSFFAYDNEKMSQALGRLSALLDGVPHDPVLNRSLRYLGLGDALVGLLPPSAPEEQRHSIMPLRFLQYWKSLATIVGDPSRDKDHQLRPQKIGLQRTFFRQRVHPMNEIRNKFDVAHVFDLRERRVVSGNEVVECRTVAKIVIDAYFEMIRQEKLD